MSFLNTFFKYPVSLNWIAQVRAITFHSLRHTFASHYMMSGGNIYDLKKLMGHSDIETTERYAHLAPEHLREKARLVSFQSEQFGNVISISNTKRAGFGLFSAL